MTRLGETLPGRKWFRDHLSGSGRSLAFARVLALVRRERFYVCMVVAYFIMRGIALAGTSPTWDIDTGAYIRPANFSFFSVWMWGGGRPWLVPFLYKALGSSFGGLMLFQSIVAAACWIILAATFARAVEGRALRRFAFGFVLLLSLSINVTRWDERLASDSLSLSLAALVFAGAIETIRRPTARRVALLVIAGFLWAGDRDTNALVAVILFVPLGIVLAVGRRFRLGIVLAVAGVLIVTTSTLSSNANNRWEMAMLDVLSFRILPDPEATQFFANHGMPLSPAVEGLRGRDEGKYWYDLNKPQYASFMRWFVPNMQPTYERYVLLHPRLTMLKPLQNPMPLISPNVTYYQAPDLRPVLPSYVEEAVYPMDQPELILETALLCVLCGFYATRRLRRLWSVPLIFGLSTIPHAIIVWNGEPGNIDKHSITLATIYRLTLAFAVVLLLNEIRERRRRTAVGDDRVERDASTV